MYPGRQMGTSTGFEVDPDFTAVGGKREKASSHRCSQAAVRRTSTSLLNEDTLSRPENTAITHILWFSQIYSTFEGDTSFCLHWNILAYQVSLVALGSKLKEGRGNFVFQHGPETADGCTS